MSLQNTLAPAPQQMQQQIEVTYKAGNVDITLTPDIIKRYLVSGDADRVTAQEVGMFLKLCQYQGLNPFTRDVYLVKYGNSPAQIVTGKSALEKRAMRNPRYKGFEAGIFIVTPNGEFARRTGTLYMQGERIVGGWAKVYVDGYEKPVEATVSFNEYNTGKALWASKPATMIRKVAKMQALREAFPEECAGLYDSSEMGVDETQLPETPVAQPIINPPIQANTPPMQSEQQPQPMTAEQPEQVNFADIMEG